MSPSPVPPAAAGTRVFLARRAVAAVLVVLATACTPATATPADPRPLALASISIIADHVRAVVGDRYRVETLVEVGGDPHAHEPVPSDAERVADAAIVFRNGLGLEHWLDPLLEANDPGPVVVTVSDAARDLPAAKAAFTGGEPDPHLWMDPVLAGAYVRSVAAGMSALDPAHAGEYQRNADAYQRELMGLDREIAASLAAIPAPNRRLVTTHDAFRYFGARYGLEIGGTIWSVSTEVEPSASQVSALVDDLRRQRVPTVFIETTINPKLMVQVARDAGTAVGQPLHGDSVGEPGSGAETYIGMMRHNTAVLTAGLAESTMR